MFDLVSEQIINHSSAELAVLLCSILVFLTLWTACFRPYVTCFPDPKQTKPIENSPLNTSDPKGLEIHRN
jgi:hypothetical protein